MLIVQSGPRTGHRLRLDADFATLGRHPSSDLQFDPERDLDVSARHAAVFRQGGTYVVRDLGSTNGTWLNGARVRSDTTLEPGDRIRLGARGPEVEFTLTTVEHRPPPRMTDPLPSPAPPAVSTTPVTAAAAPTPPKPPSRAPGDEPDTDLRIRMEVARQTDQLRRRIGTVLLLLVVAAGSVAGWFLYRASLERQAVLAERNRLLSRVDSLERGLGGAADQAEGLRLALDSARLATASLRALVGSGGGNPDSLAALEDRINAAIVQHGRLIDAAGFDVADLVEANTTATVMVFAQFDDGRIISATGFVARSVGDTGWVATTRHSITDQSGRPAWRIVVTLPGRRSVYRARTIRLHDTLDLAVFRIYSAAGIPSVSRLEPRLADVGDPVAVMGYPHGLDLPMMSDSLGPLLSPTTNTGTVTRSLETLLQFDGYGAAGASGSPVFGVTGGVVGMLYGGQAGTGGRVVYAVPAARLLELLPGA